MIKKAITTYRKIPIQAKATLWFTFCSMMQKCTSVITTPIFARIMSQEQLGQFTVYNSWLQIFTILVTLRLNYAVFNKGMSKYKNGRDAYTSTMQTITFSIASIMLLIYILFHTLMNRLTELPTFIMVAIFVELLFTPAIDFWTIRKRYEYIYIPVVVRTVLMTLLNAGLGVVAVLLSDEKGYARILSCVAVNIAFGSVLFIYNRKRGGVWFVKEYAIFAITFNIPLMMHYISLYILDQFDRIMVQKMVSMAAAGLYGVAYNAGLVMKIVTQSINNALIPWQYGKLEKKQLSELDDVLFLIFIIVSACGLLFICFAPEIMLFQGGRRYLEAVYVIPPVALGVVFSFMYTTFANVEFYYDQNKFTMFISMGGAAINVILNYFGIKMFGYVAAAYTTLLCYVLFTLGHYIYMTHSVKKELNITCVFNTKRLVGLSAAVLAAGLSIIFFYKILIARLAAVAVICCMVFFMRDKLKGALETIKKKKNK